ncbi:MAG TPA: hypothetical protein VNO30_09215 [Kofleriaceae bacterium]|nr:hypothetical protein [Kofleriaceae bacterium]
MSPRTAALVASLALALAGAPARAEDAIVKGSVVKIEQREIYVSLGTGQGVASGAPIRIKRPIKLAHPVTRAAIEDWLPVGSATVTQAGASLSRAVVGDLVTAIRVGDVAEVLVSRPDARPPTPTPTPTPTPAPAPPPQPPVDPVTREVLAVFAAQVGQSLEARIAAWERYLSTHQGSPYAASIRADLEALQALREELGLPNAARTDAPIDPAEHSVPGPTTAGQPLAVVFVIARPEQVASAYLHFRSGDRRTYQRALLVREHEIYLRGVVPAEVVRAPGVEYFVEVSTPAGGAGLALGSPESPVRVAVKPPPLTARFGDQAGRTTVRVAGEHLDFATFDHRRGDRRDRMTTGTLDVSYEIGAAVQRVGIGAGAIVGSGGFRDIAWDDVLLLPEAGFNYGRADVELGRSSLALGLAGIAGVGKDGLGLGFEARGRIGARRATHLQLLVQTLPELGWFVDTRLGARPARDLLLGISVGATDQPNQGDTAAKLGAELEWIGLPRVVLRVRGSWQGRSVAHGGIGGGAAVELTW